MKKLILKKFQKIKSKFRYFHCVPIKDWHTNSNLSGKNFDNVGDLPITLCNEGGQDRIASVWTCGFWGRIKFLFNGKINFICFGRTHPPITISIGEAFEKVH